MDKPVTVAEARPREISNTQDCRCPFGTFEVAAANQNNCLAISGLRFPVSGFMFGGFRISVVSVNSWFTVVVGESFFMALRLERIQ
jgi:hypothetical protein